MQKKRLLSLVLACFLALGLAACGGTPAAPAEDLIYEDDEDLEPERCAYVDEDGVRCRNQSRPGSRFCGVHDELVMGEPGADIIDDADDLI